LNTTVLGTHADRLAKISIGDAGVRVGVAGVVEYVEGVEAEVEGLLLVDVEVFERRGVGSTEAGAADAAVR
jgi:hypothetical protein